jgi:SAM-dependent methyltransferase
MPADHAPGPAPDPGDWTAAYLRARDREGWLLPDAVVAVLPAVARRNPLEREWRQRADSADRLLTYLRRRRRPVTIVDLGCGNGWLANRMAAVAGAVVVGMDLNAVELDQARRVFGGRRNLRFAAGDIRDGALPVQRPDLVILASVIQYLPAPADLVEALLHLVAPGGEIHVLDSPIYRPADVAGARQRTGQHYARLGVEEMAERYHHHAWDEFGALVYDVLYRPDDPIRRLERRLLRRPRSPFPWIRFRRDSGR